MSTAFGFGQGVTGGDGAANTMTLLISSKEQLIAALTPLAQFNSERAPMVLELQTPTTDPYDFSDRDTHDQAFPIRARNITIRGKAGSTVTVTNIQLALDLRFIDNVLIENLAFHSDGLATSTSDAITLNTPGPNQPGGDEPPDLSRGSDPQARVRITGCSFDGYRDISIDSASRFGYPRLLMTIDHCLFFDSKPGEGNFVNRGAINFSSAPINAEKQTRGNAYVTIAFNAFIEVWRRMPRIVQGNIAHVFNNVLFRWGAGNTTDPTWVGMAIGGGTGERTLSENGTAVIEVNRFIPYIGKAELNHAIEIGGNAVVDLRNNRFDDKDGVELPGNPLPPPPTRGFTTINIQSYLGPSSPDVVQSKNSVNWADIVTDAGPAGFDTIKTGVLTILRAHP